MLEKAYGCKIILILQAQFTFKVEMKVLSKKLDQIMAVYLVNMKGLGFSPLDLGGVFWPQLQSSFLPPLI